MSNKDNNISEKFHNNDMNSDDNKNENNCIQQQHNTEHTENTKIK